MQTREELRRQIAVAGDLRTVVGTMKGLAAVTIRQFEQALAALEDYLDTVEQGVQVALRGSVSPPWRRDEPVGLGLVVFGSDRGLCGALNRLVAAKAEDVAARADPAHAPWIAASGERLAAELEVAGLEPSRRYRAPASAEAITAVVDDLLVALDAEQARGRRIVLITPRPRETAARYVPTAHQLLPLAEGRLDRIAERPWPSRRLPEVVGDPRAVLASLSRALISVDLHRAVAETAVAVHGSRLAAMQAAERNIDERLDELTRSYHRVRQAEITEELLDVVSGFETLRRS